MVNWILVGIWLSSCLFCGWVFWQKETEDNKED